ncbi:Hypothetical protein PHPALM_13349 [Phytophthora palmivora]|uniref:Gag protein n=1 Tax=Phytophthora palmivora TaxID=4796 RepID=A0A2P4XXP7_9STRA|nr:Hypothetical protein PHPALM_13349 [Phytophthora palmivora]
MRGSFDLYEVQLRTFLTRLGCWGVVDGSYRTDPQSMMTFAERDNAAREAILQTKREYSNYIFTRDEFVSNRYTPGKAMHQWIREMETLRRRLLHFGKRVTDEDYAETLLGHVSRTHRDVVRQFSKHYVVRDGGATRPVPTAAQVMNALLAESALDERVAIEDEMKPTHVCSCGKRTQGDSQQPKPNTKPSQGGKKYKGKGR